MATFLLIVLLLDAVILAVAVLLQAGQGGGLAALGGGAGDTLMGGRQATTLLTKVTWWCGGIFLSLAFVLHLASTRTTGPGSVLETEIQAPTPVQTVPLPFEQVPQTEGAQPAQPPPREDNPPNER